MKLSCRIVLAIAMLVALGGSLNTLQAQGLTGQISGTVTDSGGGVMPGATVTVKNAGTNLTRETVTGADGAFLFPDLLAGTYDINVTVERVQDLRAEGHRAGVDRARRAARDRARSRRPDRNGHRAGRGRRRCRRRPGAVRADHARATSRTSRSRAATSPACSSSCPGVIDTSNRDAPGWGSMGGLTINGRSAFNFSYDGVTNKDTGSNSGNYAAPALDSIAEVRVQTSNFQAEYGRSSGATITVVTRSGSKDFRGSAAYYKRDDEPERQRVQPPAAVRPGRDRPVRAAALQVRQRRLDARRSGAHSGHRLQQGPQQAVLLLLAGHPAAHRSGQPEPAPDADRARAQGRLLADVRQPGRARVHPRSAARRATAAATDRRARLLPGQHHSGQPDRPDRRSAAEPVPAAERDDPTGGRQYNYVFQTVQDWPRNDQVLRVDWNIAPQTTLRPRCSSATRSAPAACRSSARRRRLAAAAEQVRDRHGQLRQHAAAHLQPDARSPSSPSA